MEKIFIRFENLVAALTPKNPTASKLLDALTAIAFGSLLALALVSWWTS